MKKIIYIFFASSFHFYCNLPEVEISNSLENYPVAEFSYNNAGCFAPCEIEFINESIYADSVEWNFGDGSSVSNHINPIHLYEKPGEFSVKLTVFNSQGQDTLSQVLSIKTNTFITTIGKSSLDDVGYSIQQTLDGGYIISGYSSIGDNLNIYLIKTDNKGDLDWDNNTYGGTKDEVGYCVQQTPEGGYIVSGYTKSFDGFLSGQVYLVKTNHLGSKTWDKHPYGGGTNAEIGYFLQQTEDGGYLIAGVTGNAGGKTDVYLIKATNQGDLTWKKAFDPSGTNDGGNCIQKTQDGGFVITGYAGGGGTKGSDVYIIKIDHQGNKIWDNNFGGNSDDEGMFIQQTSDGGYIVVGNTKSFGAGGKDVYLIKTNSQGDSLWTQTYGGSDEDLGFSVTQTSDGGYIIVGSTKSFGAGGKDVYLIKVNDEGVKNWARYFGGALDDEGYCIKETTDEGFIITGYSQTGGVGGKDVFLIKTDKDGNVQ
ncbi:MAG: PKD domain-containing protein [Saprospiraceae bacterium]